MKTKKPIKGSKTTNGAAKKPAPKPAEATKKPKGKAKTAKPLEPGQARCGACGWEARSSDACFVGAKERCGMCKRNSVEHGPEVEAEKATGVLLERGRPYEVEVPMTAEELDIARVNAIEAKGALAVAMHAVEVCKAELREAKLTEDERRATWDELGMRVARAKKKVRVGCRVVLENDDKVRAYREDTGELLDEREATREEVKKARQPSLFAVDGGPMADADAATPPAEPAPVVALAETKAKKGKGPAKLDAPTEAEWLAEEPAKAPEGEAPAPLREVEYDAPGTDLAPETEPYHRRFGDDGSDATVSP
jgi:hypothetical protein